jgi:fructosamine-3-kinase
VGTPITSAVPVVGGDICQAYRVGLADGRTAFVKTRADAPPGFFQTEAAGLTRLGAVERGVPVPLVYGAGDRFLMLEWVGTGSPTRSAAERFGRELAVTHRTGATSFGSSTPSGWIGSLPLPSGPWPDWPTMWAQGRVAPFLHAARRQGSISGNDADAVERVVAAVPALAGPPEDPALLHGDLWSGNVLWSADGSNRLIDPAVQGGHRESDLAMLALFGLPHLDHVLTAYQEIWPLADGWRERLPLHQLHPVLVHAVLFGGSYGAAAGRLARLALQDPDSAA